MNFFINKNQEKIKTGIKALKTNRGFSLIETFIAITILMLTVVGPLNIARKVLKTSAYSRDKTIAYFLAVDAAEYIRATRDKYMMEDPQTGWTKFKTTFNFCYPPEQRIVPAPGNAASGCRFGPTSQARDAVAECWTTNTTSCIMKYDPQSGLYTYNNTNPQYINSSYGRWIRISETVPGQEVLVTVMSYWTGSANNNLNRITLNTVLTKH